MLDARKSGKVADMLSVCDGPAPRFGPILMGGDFYLYFSHILSTRVRHFYLIKTEYVHKVS